MSIINPCNIDSVKIAFSFHSNVLEEWTVETIWAQIVDTKKGFYKIDNIPFYASAALDDVVHAEYDDAQERLIYKETVEYSGNSTIQVAIMTENTDTNGIRDIFATLGCESEKFKEGYFVVNVPAEINYLPIKSRLSDLQKKGIIDYAESCLSENHWY
ncbi:DUF4265 domain-containing protein [Dyadobacter diqingensis]|uniref:DUF4265 domain-containing protein n=1 Tax=Dyadobacter diqingensis TaxID=2938121 RepID=UPI0020C1B8CB|nr:DUF4265 domain-containing protein [Dyadobacter diqingensis]